MLTTAGTAAPRQPKPFHLKPPSAQAGMLCGQRRFQRWLAETYPTLWTECRSDTDTATAAATVRHLCAVDSRRDLDSDPGRADWASLLRAWVDHDTGRL